MSRKIAKPLMQLMKCQTCNHAVTGEVKRKASGKTYIYYHCANPRCSQRRICTEQKELFQQFAIAFEPFARFTPKATAAFVNTIRGRAKDIGLHSVQEVNRLREKQAQLNQRLREVEDLQQRGVLSATELDSIQATSKQEVEDTEVEIGAHLKADMRTMEVGLNILAGLFCNARLLARSLHSGMLLVLIIRRKHSYLNPCYRTLSRARRHGEQDGTVEFDYRKPFDDLLHLTGGRNWWT